ncbi:gtp-binding protein [Lasius niger]|uniref:Gtp-binding protein n=1 Tax=Lasius niger TaxID=67767 RepID=A0A0J7MR36_LASNI|nr:gtp-binding protein [Lasius niger]
MELGVGQQGLAADAIEAWMHVRYKIHGLAHPQPRRQHRHIGDKCHLFQQLSSLAARVHPQHLQPAAEIGQPQQRLQ